MTCGSCGTENRAGAKFCVECGTELSQRCAACGTPFDSGRFCAECGEPVPGVHAPAPAAGDDRPPPEAERRLVSVLFADLVGFTTLSEGRDPEETRELLSRYFDAAQKVIGRYGGTVEKFIGDAVMALWGAPVAMEDDAERAVRTALDLVAEIADLGGEAGVPGLGLRAGVATGEAAVTIGAEGQGLVAGDLVNTASRIQGVADPGTLLVDDATRRSTEAAIAYEDAGQHVLKGKAESVSLWRALRVVAARGGEGRASGLEAPFVGRDAEFRLVRNLFNATVDERRAHLVSVIGVAGIGKSRLAWEFEKYVDGLFDLVRWHRGRCLAYGEGVAFWALAEMVRSRAEIVEDESPAVAREKLRACIELHIEDPEERAWIEPRLAHLLGLAERVAPDREDLFSAWRLFLERLAERLPTVLLFEDLHWADPSLLDFVEYLLEWSRNHPIFVLTLARPELTERRPGWGAQARNFHSLFLEPLPEESRDDLLLGLVPGLPEELRARILERAEGVPLYAIETVRMLLDRGLLVRTNGGYGLSGPVEALEVPETLQALIAARLDGLGSEERRLLQDASVLGRTFTAPGLAGVSGVPNEALDPMLASLVRREILTVEADPRSPERGQYGFLHALVQKVAYDTLSRQDRKARHLAVADYLETQWSGDDAEIVEVVAAHYLEAYRAAPDAEDATVVKAGAVERLARAAERAASLAANEEAQRYFEQAAALADSPRAEAELRERAGEAGRAAGRFDAAASEFERAIALFESIGETHPAARVSARLGRILHDRGRSDEAIEQMEQAFRVLSTDEPDSDLAGLAHELARLHYFRGDIPLAIERIELALEISESLQLPEIVSQSLNTKSLVRDHRLNENTALLHEALRIALEHDLTAAALRAYNNLVVLANQQDRFDDCLHLHEDALALARRRGDRSWEWTLTSSLVEYHSQMGEWEEALAIAAGMPPESRALGFTYFPAEWLTRVHAERGELDEARALGASVAEREQSPDLQSRGIALLALATLYRAEGRPAEACGAAQQAYTYVCTQAPQYRAEAGAEISEAAFMLGELHPVQQILADWAALMPARRPQSLRAHEGRIAARLGALQGEGDAVEARYHSSAAAFRGIGMRFWLAVTLLEHGEWLTAVGRADEAQPMLDEARALFEQLRARPWLERLERALGRDAVGV